MQGYIAGLNNAEYFQDEKYQEFDAEILRWYADPERGFDSLPEYDEYGDEDEGDQ
jgi:hypothetical protein